MSSSRGKLVLQKIAVRSDGVVTEMKKKLTNSMPRLWIREEEYEWLMTLPIFFHHTCWASFGLQRALLPYLVEIMVKG